MYIAKFIKAWWTNRQYSKLIDEAIEREQLVSKLSVALETQLERANGGRIWGVLNPYIKNGKYSPEQVFEIEHDGGTDDTVWLRGWYAKKMSVIRNYITTQNLLEVLVYRLEDVGDSNYLLVLEPTTRAAMLQALKKMFYEVVFLAGAVTLGAISLILF